MKTTFYNLLILIVLLFLSLSCENDDVDVPEEPTAQELILGTWNLTMITSEEFERTYPFGEITISFDNDSMITVSNSGDDNQFFNLGLSNKEYFVEYVCGRQYNISCPVKDRYPAIFIEDIYNSLIFGDDGLSLIYGQEYVDGANYHLVKIENL